jgi:hypothetical protein
MRHDEWSIRLKMAAAGSEVKSSHGEMEKIIEQKNTGCERDAGCSER